MNLDSDGPLSIVKANSTPCMKSSAFPSRSFLRRFRPCLLAGIITCIATSLLASQSTGIGDGSPGLKVATKESGAIVIYQDEPTTVGIGLMGGMLERKIKVILDQGYGFRQEAMQEQEQLYPFDEQSAFTSEIGSWGPDYKAWRYVPRKSVGYRLADGRITVFESAQEAAREKYQLKPDEVFLGAIDHKVFFWKAFDPSIVFWRTSGSAELSSYRLPKRVIDLYGITRGITNDVGVVVFERSPGLIHYSPYTTEFIQFSTSATKD